MNTFSRLGRFGLALAVVIAGLVLGAAPAHAAELWQVVRYENVGNPGWCMGSDPVSGPYLERCDRADDAQRWMWITGGTRFVHGVRLRASGNFCLTVRPAPYGSPRTDTDCNPDDPSQYWNVWGQNGWVVYQLPNSSQCLIPNGTGTVASHYPLVMVDCPVQGVPNIFAWRYSS